MNRLTQILLAGTMVPALVLAPFAASAQAPEERRGPGAQREGAPGGSGQRGPGGPGGGERAPMQERAAPRAPAAERTPQPERAAPPRAPAAAERAAPPERVAPHAPAAERAAPRERAPATQAQPAQAPRGAQAPHGANDSPRAQFQRGPQHETPTERAPAAERAAPAAPKAERAAPVTPKAERAPPAAAPAQATPAQAPRPPSPAARAPSGLGDQKGNPAGSPGAAPSNGGSVLGRPQAPNGTTRPSGANPANPAVRGDETRPGGNPTTAPGAAQTRPGVPGTLGTAPNGQRDPGRDNAGRDAGPGQNRDNAGRDNGGDRRGDNGRGDNGRDGDRRGDNGRGIGGAVAIGAAAGLAGGFLAATGARDLEGIRRDRRETVEDGRTYIREPGRTIVDDGGRSYVVHDENDRFRELGYDVRRERDGSNFIDTVDRPDGTRILTYTTPDGRLLRRVRRYRDGREYVLIDNSFNGGVRSYQDDVVDLPPPRIGIPRDRYDVAYQDVGEDVLYDTFAAPPLQAPPRRYTLDQIRYSPDVRRYVRSVDINTINFDTGSWIVPAAATGKLQALASAIKKTIAKDPNTVFLVEGFTDATGNPNDNLSLSDRRAQSVAAILSKSFGVPPENLTTQGYGQQDLKENTQGPSAINRRVVVQNITPLLAAGGQTPR